MTIQEKIAKLKEEKDAVILAHYYVAPEVQDVADYVGDSFYLSKLAQGLTNRTIVYCGVDFMGESGKLLSPDKQILLPDRTADCPMAHMVHEEDVDRFRAEYEDLAVVCYINSTAEIKTWADVCVTSSNALKVVRSLPNKNILFIPDKNLGHYVAQQIPEKNVMVLDGYCPIHEHIDPEEIKALMDDHPNAKVLVHPECRAQVLELAHYIGSTSGILKYAAESSDREFIVSTEVGVRHPLERDNPCKTFYFPKTTPVCPGMKTITLEKVVRVLESGEGQVEVPPQIAQSAGAPLKRMLALTE